MRLKTILAAGILVIESVANANMANFKLPSGWVKSPLQSKDYFSAMPSLLKTSEASVVAINLAKKLTSEEAILKEIKATPGVIESSIQKTSLRLGKKQYTRLEYFTQTQSRHRKHQAYLTKNNNYLILYSAPTAEFENHTKKIEGMLKQID